MRVLVILMTAMLTGCGTTLPTYDAMSPEAAWEIVRERALSVPAFSAVADATLAGGDGSSVRVDAAIAMAPPDRMRLRAWKLGHAVLDVTSAGGVVWVDAAPTPEGAAEINVSPEDIARGLMLIPAWGQATLEPASAERRKGEYVFVFEVEDGDLVCVVDERTLTVQRWRMSGDEEYEVELSGYRLVGDVAWAHGVLLAAGDRSMRLRLSDIDLANLPDARAFTPPPGARSVP